jgi:hypothetical protein
VGRGDKVETWSWWSTTLLKMVIDWNVIKCLDGNDL